MALPVQCRSGARALLTKREGVRAFSVSFSPDGTWLAVGYLDGQVELWDIAARSRVKLVQGPWDAPAHVAFSPNGDVFAATRAGGVVKAHNVTTGVETLLSNGSKVIRDLSYSRDGELLTVLGSSPGAVQVRNAADGALVMNYPLPIGHDMHFNNARLSPDKRRL
jgi:WD40 repeat protein